MHRDRGELEGLDRESLVVRAQAAGIRRARILTRPELIDELLRLDPKADAASLRKSRGFFGKARDLVARVVERGLHLPDAADRIRTLSLGAEQQEETRAHRGEPQAMPTVTLAEIYAAQGHRARAIETLRRVLEREPEHAAAQALLARLEDEGYVAPPPPLPPEPEIEPEPHAGEEEDEEEAVLGPSDQNGEAELVLVPPSGPSEQAEYVDAPAIEEQDECIAVPIAGDASGARMYVRWSVSWSTLGALLGAMPSGRFVVRAHIVMPSWDEPAAATRDLIVDPDLEQVTLVGLPEPSVVRVAIGWLDGSRFVPLAHSPALEMTESRGLVIWTTKGAVPVIMDDPRAASIARAVDASRRAPQART